MIDDTIELLGAASLGLMILAAHDARQPLCHKAEAGHVGEEDGPFRLDHVARPRRAAVDDVPHHVGGYESSHGLYKLTLSRQKGHLSIW